MSTSKIIVMTVCSMTLICCRPATAALPEIFGPASNKSIRFVKRVSRYTGYREVELPDAYPNQFVYDEQAFIAYVDHVDEDYVYLAVDSRDHLMNQRFWGLAPRNLEQAMAMRLLDSEDVDMTVLTGPAGSGKTLLALAYGLHAILEQRKYNKLIVARSTPPIAEEIGFLARHRRRKDGALVGGFRRQPGDSPWRGRMF